MLILHKRFVDNSLTKVYNNCQILKMLVGPILSLYRSFRLFQISVLNKWRKYKMEDKTLVCQDCGQEFVFTAGEQAFYKEKGFDNEPKRCKACREKRKNERRQPRQE